MLVRHSAWNIQVSKIQHKTFGRLQIDLNRLQRLSAVKCVRNSVHDDWQVNLHMAVT